ncbi:hypothetical protein M422DRAFT_239465 [Sphaerobolus stellatus SS14]|nr:hypothetical protein M422DRAFT_239465 [Sphaerobolus stellatus SS14]
MPDGYCPLDISGPSTFAYHGLLLRSTRPSTFNANVNIRAVIMIIIFIFIFMPALLILSLLPPFSSRLFIPDSEPKKGKSQNSNSDINLPTAPSPRHRSAPEIELLA